MSLSDLQARAILQKFDNNPLVLLGMQAVAKALTNYGQPPGWVTPDNNWYAVTTGADANGQCVSMGGLSTTLVAPGVCSFVYQTPEQGISHALNLWFPQQPDGTSGPEGLKFYQALINGDTDTIAQMVMQRVWGIPTRAVTTPGLGPLAAWTFAADFYNAAQSIAANLNQTSHFKYPSPGLLSLQLIPIPIELVPVPLPTGEIPGGGGLPEIPTPDGGTPTPPDNTNPPIVEPPPEEKKEGYPWWKWGLGIAAAAGGAWGLSKVLK